MEEGSAGWGSPSFHQGSEFGEDARKAATAFKEKGDVRVFDTYLDHAFYKSLDKSMFSESKLQDVQKLVTVDIDTYNVLAVLRAKYWGLSAAETNDLPLPGATRPAPSWGQSLPSSAFDARTTFSIEANRLRAMSLTGRYG